MRHHLITPSPHHPITSSPMLQSPYRCRLLQRAPSGHRAETGSPESQGHLPRIPGRARAKSYRTGSSGFSRRSAAVASRAKRPSADFLPVSPKNRTIRATWVSTGRSSSAGLTQDHNPRSNPSSGRQTHLRKSHQRLQADPEEGRGVRWRSPGVGRAKRERRWETKFSSRFSAVPGTESKQDSREPQFRRRAPTAFKNIPTSEPV
jgi:hypothetical protein